MSQESAQAMRPGQDHEWDCSSLPALAGSLEAESVELESALPALKGRAWMLVRWRASGLMQAAGLLRDALARPNRDAEARSIIIEMVGGPGVLELGAAFSAQSASDHNIMALAQHYAVKMQIAKAVGRARAAEALSAAGGRPTEPGPNFLPNRTRPIVFSRETSS